MKTTLLLAVALTLLLGYVAVSQTPTAGGSKHHVAFQLSEGDDTSWNSLVIHVNNTMKALGDDGGADVEVVFWGAGLGMIKKTNVAYEERLKQLSDHGVKLLACRNAMKNRNVTTEDLFSFAGQVDSGIAEVVRKQEAGWAYIH
jgi:intracellular sulfur oxidation DsrE/DsrF family protein